MIDPSTFATTAFAHRDMISNAHPQAPTRMMLHKQAPSKRRPSLLTPSTSAKRRRCINQEKRSVTFSDSSQMFLVSSFVDEAPEDSLWYTFQELEDMKADNVRSIITTRILLSPSLSRRYQQLVPAEPETLGLERHLRPELTTEHKRRKRDVFDAVAAEQAWQRRLGESDPERLAVVSGYHSRWAADRARAGAVALRDDLLKSKI